jgi:uncharacterized protein (TIGR00369 family)
MNPREMAGFDLLKAVSEGKLPYPSIADTIPMRITELTKGTIKFIVKADNRHINLLGSVHGGFATTVLDSVTGYAVHTVLDAGVGGSTVDLNVKMLRPIPLDVELFGEGCVIHISKSLGVSEGAIKDNDGKLYAHGTATCIILRP